MADQNSSHGADRRQEALDALKSLYDRGAHLFAFHVERDPKDPTKKHYTMPPAWQRERDRWKLIEAAVHDGTPIGLIVGSLDLSVPDIDVKDGKDGPERQRLGIERCAAVQAWAGVTPCIVRTPTGGLHLFYRRRAPHGKRVLSGILPVQLEVFGDTGFIELYDPVRLLKHLDTLPLLSEEADMALRGHQSHSERDSAPSGRRGRIEGDRNQGAFVRSRSAMEHDRDPVPAIAAAIDDAIAAGLDVREAATAAIRGAFRYGQASFVDPDLTPLGQLIMGWREEHGRAMVSRQGAVATQALRRVEALISGDTAEAVRMMHLVAGAWDTGGDAAVEGLYRHQIVDLLRRKGEWEPDVAPQWLVPGWIPLERLALLYAVGGIGKSRLSAQLMLALASGHPMWIPGAYGCKGIALKGDRPLRVLFLSWEDTWRTMQRMLRHAASALGIADPKAAMGDSFEFYYAGKMGPIWAPAKGSTHVSTLSGLTSAGLWLIDLMDEYDVIILDPLAAVYASDENQRGLVRAFIGILDEACQDRSCTLIILGHSSKEHLVSGSTDWENGVRCVLGVTFEERKSKDPADGRKSVVEGRGLQLRAVKMNEALKPDPIWLIPGEGGKGWQEGTRQMSEAKFTPKVRG